MSTATLDRRAHLEHSSTFARQLKGDPAYQAFLLLRIAFIVAPIVFGLDKFFDVLVDWKSYLAPWINDIVLTYSGYYDIALHDFGLMLGALTLARPASKYDPPGG
jgi:hypothetical protein